MLAKRHHASADVSKISIRVPPGRERTSLPFSLKLYPLGLRSTIFASDSTTEVETKEAQRALDRLMQHGFPLPEGYKFDRDEANER